MALFDKIYSAFPNTVNNIRSSISDAKSSLGLSRGGTTVDSDGFSHHSGKFGYSFGDRFVDSVAKVVNPTYGLKSGIDSFKDYFGLGDSGLNSALGVSGSGSSGGYYYSDPGSYAPDSVELNYPNAALAQLYGMDAETAYHEALANTAIQRRMLDYKAAGLNPILAAQYNSGADSFSGNALSGVSAGSYSPSGGSVYTPTSAGNGSSAKGFSDLMKISDYRSALAAVASAGTMMVTKNFQIGAAAYYGVKGYLNSKYGYRK